MKHTLDINHPKLERLKTVFKIKWPRAGLFLKSSLHIGKKPYYWKRNSMPLNEREKERDRKRKWTSWQTNKRGKSRKTNKNSTRLNYAHKLRGKHTVNRLEELKKKKKTNHLQTVLLLFQITKMKNDVIPATLYRGGMGAVGAAEPRRRREEHGSERGCSERSHTVRRVEAPKKSTCLTIHLHGLEWVVFTFGNISWWFIP